MTDDQAEVPGPEERPNKRPPPTIDLEASDVSGDTAPAGAGTDSTPRASRFRPAMLLPPLAGAIAALVVIGVLWAAGVIGAEPQQTATVPPAVASGLSDLSNRIGKVESKLSAPPAAKPDNPADSALRARVDALETLANTLRDQSAALRQQIDATSSTLNELKSAPRDGAASPDLAALSDRLARLEQAARTLPDKPQAAAPAASDDPRPRRLVIATVLETKVRRGEPYVAALAAAKSVAEDKSTLAPLDATAESGVATDLALSQELLGLLPQVAPQATSEPPAAPATKGSSSGLLGQLASNASKLVRVERVDAPPGAATAPANGNPQLQTIALLARQNDVKRARDEIAKLPPDLKAKLQPWLDHVDARDAALKTVTAFTSSALAAMSKAD